MYECERFESSLCVCLGDRQAREAMERLEVGEWSPEKIAIRRGLRMEDSTVFYYLGTNNSLLFWLPGKKLASGGASQLSLL